MVVTTERPMPGASPGILPAAEKAIGTMLEIPIPAMAKPIITKVEFPARPAIRRPVIDMTEQKRRVRTAPNLSRTRSPANRMIAMVMENAAKAKPDCETEAPSSLRR
ncbi:hypothetical protein D3C86_1527360 [compost metagenome]